MHMVSKKDFNSVELATMRISKNPTTGGDGQRRGADKRRSRGICQRIGPVRDGYAFLKKHPQFFHLESSAKIMGIPPTGPSGQKPHLTQNGKIINCNIANYVPFVVSGLSTSSSISSSPALLNIFIAGCCDQHGKSSIRKK